MLDKMLENLCFQFFNCWDWISSFELTSGWAAVCQFPTINFMAIRILRIMIRNLICSSNRHHERLCPFFLMLYLWCTSVIFALIDELDCAWAGRRAQPYDSNTADKTEAMRKVHRCVFWYQESGSDLLGKSSPSNRKISNFYVSSTEFLCRILKKY